MIKLSNSEKISINDLLGSKETKKLKENILENLRNLRDLENNSSYKIDLTYEEEKNLRNAMYKQLYSFGEAERKQIHKKLLELAKDPSKSSNFRTAFLYAYYEAVNHGAIKGYGGTMEVKKEFYPLIKDPDNLIRAYVIRQILEGAFDPSSFKECEKDMLNLKENLVKAIFDYVERYDTGYMYYSIARIDDTKPWYYLIHYLVEKIKDETKDEVLKGLESTNERVRKMAADIHKHVYQN